MKTNREDLIQALAFGELTDAERATVERDPSVTKEVNEWNSMKLDLYRLREVPAPQLSTERLRDRILNEGLRPQRRFSWAALWAPATALAAFAFAYIISANRVPDVNPIVVDSRPTQPVASAVFKEPSNIASVAKAEVTPGPAVVQASAPVKKRSLRQRPSFASRSVSKSSPLLLVRETGGSATTMALKTEPEPRREEPPAMMSDSAVASGATLASEEPLVLIQPDKSTETGAQRATEISSSNVVIGG